MAEDFKPIMTQEDLNAVLSDHVKKNYGDYGDLKKKVSDYETQVGQLTKSNGELQATIKGHETKELRRRIAHEKGIPFEMADRLSGDTEADIRKDAEAMAKYVTRKHHAPGKDTEPEGVDEKKAALKKMLQEMRGE